MIGLETGTSTEGVCYSGIALPVRPSVCVGYSKQIVCGANRELGATGSERVVARRARYHLISLQSRVPVIIYTRARPPAVRDNNDTACGQATAAKWRHVHVGRRYKRSLVSEILGRRSWVSPERRLAPQV